MSKTILKSANVRKEVQEHGTCMDITVHQPANDTLYHELELRYGGGFAQWVVDKL